MQSFGADQVDQVEVGKEVVKAHVDHLVVDVKFVDSVVTAATEEVPVDHVPELLEAQEPWNLNFPVAVKLLEKFIALAILKVLLDVLNQSMSLGGHMIHSI